MIQLSVSVEGAETLRHAYAQARETLLERVSASMRRHTLRAVAIIQQRYRSGPRSPTSTAVGTGNLRASYTSVQRRSGTEVAVDVGLMRLGAKGRALSYGAVHEEGATIRPTRAQYLAIPLATVRSPAGIAPPPRSFPHTFVIPARRGDGLVLMQRQAGGAPRPIFKLQKSVTIPARPPGGAVHAGVTEVLPALEADLVRDGEAVLGAER
jgi:hypothetical protein